MSKNQSTTNIILAYRHLSSYGTYIPGMISGNTGTVPTQNKSHLHIKKCFTNIELLTVSYISPPNISNYCMEIVASKLNVVLTVLLFDHLPQHGTSLHSQTPVS